MNALTKCEACRLRGLYRRRELMRTDAGRRLMQARIDQFVHSMTSRPRSIASADCWRGKGVQP